MDSSTIYSCLDIIAGEPKTSVKIALLEEFLEDEDFRDIISMAYNPLVTYGVLAIEPPLVPGDQDFTMHTFDILEKLANRELTGNEAHAEIKDQLSVLNKESGELFIQILNKDLRAGFTAKSINKARPGTIQRFPYMRCSTLNEVDLKLFDWNLGVYSQVKADGMFCNIDASDGIRIFTRQGQPFPGWVSRSLYDVLMPGYQYHGEMVMYKDNQALSRKTSNGLLNKVRQYGDLSDREEIHFFLWDMVPIKGIAEGEHVEAYSSRFANLQQMLFQHVKTVHTIPFKVVHSIDEAQEHFKKLIDKGYEGTILKDSRAIWKDGTSRLQVKLKAEKECELRVIGLNEGKGKYKGSTGSIVCSSDDGGVEVNVSGFTDEERDEIWDNWSKWINSIVTVRFNEVIDDKNSDKLSLFSPRFVEKREDKQLTDTIEYIQGL